MPLYSSDSNSSWPAVRTGTPAPHPSIALRLLCFLQASEALSNTSWISRPKGCKETMNQTKQTGSRIPEKCSNYDSTLKCYFFFNFCFPHWQLNQHENVGCEQMWIKTRYWWWDPYWKMLYKIWVKVFMHMHWITWKYVHNISGYKSDYKIAYTKQSYLWMYRYGWVWKCIWKDIFPTF